MSQYDLITAMLQCRLAASTVVVQAEKVAASREVGFVEQLHGQRHAYLPRFTRSCQASDMYDNAVLHWISCLTGVRSLRAL
ncbi:hypothetical protein J1614_008133 [Plenodomus biglobosus]|nr:hypothetical protein J1614_008133 [Plenodomus biglobosus]